MNQRGHLWRIRLAVPADVPLLTVLIDLSVRSLHAQDYSPAQIEGALGTVLGVDRHLISDGTYFVAEASGSGGTEIVGCGGWSRRRTLFGSDSGPGREDAFLDPLRENARIRAFFVHPAWARRGIGSGILEACELAAVEEGFRGFELGATITGERLYRARGYEPLEQIEVALPNGVTVPVIRMSKAVRG